MERNGTNPSKTRHGLSDLSPSQLEARIAEIDEHLDAIDALLADAHGLSAEQRQKATRLRGEGEVVALRGVLEFATVHAELFAALADEDEGVDPETFETKVLVNRLHNVKPLSTLADRVDALGTKIHDCALFTTQVVKPVALEAYAIAKSFAGRVSRSDLLFPAQDFYGAGAISAARNRAKKKAGRTP